MSHDLARNMKGGADWTPTAGWEDEVDSISRAASGTWTKAEAETTSLDLNEVPAIGPYIYRQAQAHRVSNG
jgi:hypothetical protein